jgi:hypothetical protein
VKQQKNTFETIQEGIEEIRKNTANRLGAKSLRDQLRASGLLVPR